MKAKAFAIFGAAIGISLANAESFKAPEIEFSVSGAVPPSESYPPEKYVAALLVGAHHACKQPRRATRRYANMLQANCVTAGMRAGKDWNQVGRHCYATSQRTTFRRKAEDICAALSAHSRSLFARGGQ